MLCHSWDTEGLLIHKYAKWWLPQLCYRLLLWGPVDTTSVHVTRPVVLKLETDSQDCMTPQVSIKPKLQIYWSSNKHFWSITGHAKSSCHTHYPKVSNNYWYLLFLFPSRSHSREKSATEINKTVLFYAVVHYSLLAYKHDGSVSYLLCLSRPNFATSVQSIKRKEQDIKPIRNLNVSLVTFHLNQVRSYAGPNELEWNFAPQSIPPVFVHCLESPLPVAELLVGSDCVAQHNSRSPIKQRLWWKSCRIFPPLFPPLHLLMNARDLSSHCFPVSQVSWVCLDLGCFCSDPCLQLCSASSPLHFLPHLRPWELISVTASFTSSEAIWLKSKSITTNYP